MRILILFMVLGFSFTAVIGQTIETVKEQLKTGKLAEAKKQIDELLAKEANQKTAAFWYQKAKVYSALSMDPILGKQFPKARMDAFLALKKYTEMDDKMLVELQIDGYKPINEIYTGFYQQAANEFNVKNYAASLQGFTDAIDVSGFMIQKGWISMSLDTNSVLYAGVSAEKLNRLDDATRFYSMLINKKAKGEGFVEIYKWVTNYYHEKKNKDLAFKYLTLGKEVYPADPFWASIEMDLARETGNKQELFTLYETTISKYPENHLYRYNYAVELYQHAYNIDMEKRPEGWESKIHNVRTQLEQAVRLKPEYVRAQLFLGQVHYNEGVDLLSQSKTMEDPKEKALGKQNALKAFDRATPYFLQVEKLMDSKTALNAEEKKDLKEALDLLITIYSQKGLSEKMKEYENKLKAVDLK